VIFLYLQYNKSVISGIGEMDANDREKRAQRLEKVEKNFLIKQQQQQQDFTSDMPYLLLDLRDRDEYERSHIISAYNYPIAMLSRSINNETPELLAYKNRSGKIIVVYDDDERVSPRAATTLVERGYDNLFLLSGGMKLASRKFPDGLITGHLPAYYSLPTAKDSNNRALLNSNRSLSSSMSNMSNFSNNSTAQMAVAATKKNTFERDDIEKLSEQLEKNLMPHDMHSRMSNRSSRVSNAGSVASSTRTLNSIHEKPWKPI
jgi:centrosomal protein CEP41